MMKEMMSEVLLIATIGRKRLVLQLVIVDELGFIDVESIIRMGVGCTASILRYDISDGTIIERKDILPVLRFKQWFAPSP